MATKTRKKRKTVVCPKPKNFPLTPHASGKWMKSIKGKVYYFGNWGRIRDGVMVRLPDDGKQEALALYQAFIGTTASADNANNVAPDQVTIAVLCNSYLTAKLTKMQAGRLSSATYGEYKSVCDKLVTCFGNNRVVADLAPVDFNALLASLSKGRGLVSLSGLISKIKAVFRFGVENDLITSRVKYGTEFVKPARSELRKEKATNGKKLFTRDEVLWLLNGKQDGEVFIPGATGQLRCMILLGINCALGNTDVAELCLSNLDLKSGWLTFPRGKTGVERKGRLWPETVAALKDVIDNRAKPKNPRDKNLVFLTKYGAPWVRNPESWGKDANGERVLKTVCNINAVSGQFKKLLRELKINGRKGLGFYSLRHTFRTWADSTKDFPAVRLVMGHVDGSIDGVYREEIGDDRLEAVADHVHNWLFAKPTKAGAV